MKSIDSDLDLQKMLADLKQLEQDLLEATKNEFPHIDNDAYFTELFAEINNNKKTIDNLLEQNRAAEQEYLQVKQEEQQLENTKRQLGHQAAEATQIPTWQDKKK